MQALLLDYELPGELQAEKRVVVEHQMLVQFGPMQAELRAVRRLLSSTRIPPQRAPMWYHWGQIRQLP
jgi:hypothetical protein